MGVPATTTEATMSAIQDRLDQLHMMLGRVADRQDKMLVDLKKTTAALASSTATTSTFMSGRVLEQHTKPSSSSLFSVVQVGGAGAPRADAILASSTPTTCSTVGSAVNVGCNHVLVAFPTSADAILAPTMPTSCSAEGLAHYTDSGHAELVLSARGITHLEHVSGSEEVLTQVGGLSIFLESDQDLSIASVSQVLHVDQPWPPWKCHALYLEVNMPQNAFHSGPNDMSSSYLVLDKWLPWSRSGFSPGDWCSLQPFTTELHFVLGLGDLWRCHDNKYAWNEKRNLGGAILYECYGLIQFPRMQRENGNQCSHIFGDAVLGLITNSELVLDCTSLWPTEKRMMNIIEAGNLTLFLCQLLKEALKVGLAYVLEDPLVTLVVVTLPHTYCSGFCDIQSASLDRKLQYSPWNLGVHNQMITQVQQELCKCYYLCSLVHLTNNLEYTQWDLGVRSILGAEVIKLCSPFVMFIGRQWLVFQSRHKCQDLYSLAISAKRLQSMTWDPGIHSSVCARSVRGYYSWPRDASNDTSFVLRVHCSIWSCILLGLPDGYAVAWGQATFCRGGSVPPIHGHVLGQGTWALGLTGPELAG